MTDKITILIYILDDSESDIDLMVHCLNSDTYDIQCFTDPDKFSEALNNDVSMVITDIKINNYDVYSTVANIRAEYPGIYIIAVSGYLNKEIYEKLMDCHVWNAVEKNSTDWLDKLKKKVELTVPKILNKKMALSHDY